MTNFKDLDLLLFKKKNELLDNEIKLNKRITKLKVLQKEKENLINDYRKDYIKKVNNLFNSILIDINEKFSQLISKNFIIINKLKNYIKDISMVSLDFKLNYYNISNFIECDKQKVLLNKQINFIKDIDKKIINLKLNSSFNEDNLVLNEYKFDIKYLLKNLINNYNLKNNKKNKKNYFYTITEDMKISFDLNKENLNIQKLLNNENKSLNLDKKSNYKKRNNKIKLKINKYLKKDK